MRKQRTPSQRPGNPAIGRRTASPLSGTDAGLTSSPGFPHILRGEGRSRQLLGKLSSFLTKPSLNQPSQAARRRGVVGPRTPGGLHALAHNPRTQCERDHLQGPRDYSANRNTRLRPGTHSRDLLPSSWPHRVQVLASWQAMDCISPFRAAQKVGTDPPAWVSASSLKHSWPLCQCLELMHKQAPDQYSVFPIPHHL